MSRYDVVVVGGRVAGAATAMLLARSGLRVAVVERGRYGSDTVSTHALMRAGVLQLSRWGLLDQVVEAGTPPVRRTVFHYLDLPPVQVSLRRSGGVDALYAPRRRLLDRILVDAAAAAGADVLHHTAVTGLLRDEEGRVRGIRGTGPGGAPLELRADLTVGADGVRSLVARDAGAPVVRQGRSSSAVLYRYVADLPTAGYEWAYGPGCAAGLIPTNDGLTCVFVGTTPQRMRSLRARGTERAFAALLATAAPDFRARAAAARPSERVRGWVGVPGFFRRPWGPGWALVGDAGYYKDPISTHGMTDALRDADLLADQVVETLGRGKPPALAFRRYQAVRDGLSNRVFDATEEIAAYDWDIDRVQSLLRRVSSAMSDEVDHLQARPDHPIGTGFGLVVPQDTGTRST
jgi:flavin-dependent dehydrogenase